MTGLPASGGAAKMDPEVWDRIKTIFHAALGEPETERAAYVARTTAGDAALREQVESLLASHDESADFMETPAVALSGALSMSSIDALSLRERVGPYRLLEEIGRGGMGTVYLATRDDGQFAQRVAVKLVKRGMDTDAILARFRHERQILAALEHPNIARLLDGGTTPDGVPYFVMEYVPGKTIRDYCESRALSVDERLTLFRTVCGAVQYAHQNLVVHRDIKASNIVVTDDGIPKLLDFGIAKLLNPSKMEAATETINAMTPEYASPEQLRGDPVTTATDVYSLGVLLYELLSGRRPYATSGLRPDELVRVVIETDPLPPSARVSGRDAVALQRTLHGDLDTVVLMAMRKDPSRRYSSVERFSDDVGRYLTNRPVTAQRDTWNYRAKKFVSRNRAGIAVSALLLTTLLGGLGATIWQARVARAERARAERRFAEIRSLATSFLFDIHDEIENLPGSTPARELLVKQGLVSLAGLEKEATGDTVLERELGVAYQRMGLVQGNSYNSNLGDSKAALASYQTSVALLSRSTDSTSRNAAALNALAIAHKGLAAMLESTGNLSAALTNMLHARAELERAVALDTGHIDYRRMLANLYFELGDLQGGFGLVNIGDPKSALATYRQSIDEREWLRQRLPTDVEVRSGLGNVLVNYGSLALSLSVDDSLGLQSLLRGVALLEGVTAELPNDANRRNNLLGGYSRLRRATADNGRFTDAIALDRKMLRTLENMSAADPKNTLFERNIGVVYNSLGTDLIGAGEAPAAVEQYRKALAIALRLYASDPASAEMKQDVAYTRGALADALREARQLSVAIAEYERAIPVKAELLKSEPENPRHVGDLAAMYSGLGAAYADSRNVTSAQRAFDKAIPLAEDAAAQPNATSKTRSIQAALYARIGQMHAERASSERAQGLATDGCTVAIVWFNKSLAVWQSLQRTHQLLGAHRNRAAEVERAIGGCGVA